MQDQWNLPVAFYFRVLFGLNELAFKEVSGLTVEMDTELLEEGGVNDFVHVLPKRIKHGNLVLKRALATVSLTNPEVLWIKSIMENSLLVPIVTLPVTIQLMNSAGVAIYTWNCMNAYPVKWEIGELDSEKNNILIESLELAYTTIMRL